MEKNNLNYFKKKLYKEREDILKKINGIKEDMGIDKSIKEYTSELSSYDNHPADIASETFEMEKNIALKNNEMNLLKKIDNSLKRIEKNNYGICENCGREINIDRLEAIPYSSTCIDCERNNINYKTYKNDRPIEEEVLGIPFRDINKDYNDFTGFDGEDTWQELELSNEYDQIDDEYENMEGYVEEVEKISNEQYKNQLP